MEPNISGAGVCQTCSIPAFTLLLWSQCFTISERNIAAHPFEISLGRGKANKFNVGATSIKQKQEAQQALIISLSNEHDNRTYM